MNDPAVVREDEVALVERDAAAKVRVDELEKEGAEAPLAPDDAMDELVQSLTDAGITASRQTWRNFVKNRAREAVVVDLNNVAQVQTVIQQVNAVNARLDNRRLTVRGAAGWADDPAACPVTVCCGIFSRGREHKYNESFSFSDVAAADVIIRFDKRCQQIGRVRQQGANHSVTVSAGVQLTDLSNSLARQGYSLPTVSMIPYVTAVGLSATGGNGTGRDQPSFAGLVQRVRICNHQGNVQVIEATHQDFNVIRATHLGLFGVVLDVTLRCVPKFRLEEDIVFGRSAAALAQPFAANPQVDDLAHSLGQEYFTLMAAPKYSDAGCRLNWHIRNWRRTANPDQLKKPPYEGANIVWQEFQARLIEPALDTIVQDSDSLKAYLNFTSEASIRWVRKPSSLCAGPFVVGDEHDITHYRSAYPSKLADVSFYIPVNDADAAQLVQDVFAETERSLGVFAQNDQYPLTYAAYARYITGTNGGLSASDQQGCDHVLILDYVTHPDAPGWEAFIAGIKAFLEGRDLHPRYHYGKEFPPGIANYTDATNAEAVTAFKGALNRWYGNEANFVASPFCTGFSHQMLGCAAPMVAELTHTQAAGVDPRPHPTAAEARRQLKQAAQHIQARLPHTPECLEAREACDAFIEQVEPGDQQQRCCLM